MLLHVNSIRKAQYLQPFLSTINRYSQLKTGAIFVCMKFLMVNRGQLSVLPLMLDLRVEITIR